MIGQRSPEKATADVEQGQKPREARSDRGDRDPLVAGQSVELHPLNRRRRSTVAAWTVRCRSVSGGWPALIPPKRVSQDQTNALSSRLVAGIASFSFQ